MIGKYFSNGWKTGPDFPMIGKIFRAFSNDWKTFSEGKLDNSFAGGAREGNGRDFSHKGHKGHKEGGKESGRDVGEGNLQECLECRFADLNGLEGDGIYIEKRETRFADIEKGKEKDKSGGTKRPNKSALRTSSAVFLRFWKVGGKRQLGQLRTTFSRLPGGQLRPAETNPIILPQDRMRAIHSLPITIYAGH